MNVVRRSMGAIALGMVLGACGLMPRVEPIQPGIGGDEDLEPIGPVVEIGRGQSVAENGGRVAAIPLMPLEPFGLPGQIFYVQTRNDQVPVQSVAIDARGDVRGEAPIGP
jgi:hypothetical protein